MNGLKVNVKRLTQSVFLFSLRSLFGIKVPDCDGIAARHNREIKNSEVRYCFIGLRSGLGQTWTFKVNSSLNFPTKVCKQCLDIRLGAISDDCPRQPRVNPNSFSSLLWGCVVYSCLSCLSLSSTSPAIEPSSPLPPTDLLRKHILPASGPTSLPLPSPPTADQEER